MARAPSSPDPLRGDASVSSSAGARWPTFRALEHRDFRALWIALIISAVGTWMQIVALSLLVLQLRHGAAIALGEVSIAQALAFIICAPFAGPLADRFDRRRLLMVTQTLMMALAALLGVVTATGDVRFWMILAIAIASATILSIDQPSRFALLPSLVPVGDLTNAIALQSMIFSGAAMIGPILAGLALTAIGHAGNFFLNALSSSAVLIALIRLRPVAPDGHAQSQSSSLIASLGEGLRTIGADTILPPLILAYGVLMFFAPSPALLMPIFATKVLRLEPSGLGLLFSALGAGTVMGSILTTRLGDHPRKLRLIACGYALWCGALASFALCTALWPALGVLIIVGAAQSGIAATTITLMQQRVAPQMRGRVMSLNTVILMGIRPLGDYPLSAAITLIGVRDATVLAAAVIGLGCLYSFRGFASSLIDE
jgi:MFS family permease